MKFEHVSNHLQHVDNGGWRNYYRLWPEQPALMHIHSLLWFALLVFLAARFYRRMFEATWMAGLAALLFAIEDAHGFAAGTLFLRNGLMAGCFGFGCLIAHDAWRCEGRKWAGWLAGRSCV